MKCVQPESSDPIRICNTNYALVTLYQLSSLSCDITVSVTAGCGAALCTARTDNLRCVTFTFGGFRRLLRRLEVSRKSVVSGARR